VSLLEIQDLKVHFHTEDGVVKAVDGASFSVEKGQTLGIVGESGCGKSVANMTILGLTRAPTTSIEGRILLEGRDLNEATQDEIQAVRGQDIAMIFQDPLTSLHPFYKIGKQLTEAVHAHQDLSKRDARDRAAELLGLVGIPDPTKRLNDYPHEFSGGMRQRALDVTIQAQILHLIQELQDRLGMAVILITHDLGVVADTADYINVMYAGRIVEAGTLDEIFYDPQHPYTWGLLGSVARPDRPRTERLSQIQGQPPSLLAPPQGCHFRPRCPHEFGKCKQTPTLDPRSGTPGHLDRCWLPPEKKRTLRVIQGDQIGLEVPAA